MNAERSMQWWTTLCSIPVDIAEKELGKPVCRCAPGMCMDAGPGIEVRCDECGGVMLGSSAARATRVFIDSERPDLTVDN